MRTQRRLESREDVLRQSHLNDVDRWHPIVVVVVLGELEGKKEMRGMRKRRAKLVFFSEREDASVFGFVLLGYASEHSKPTWYNHNLNVFAV